MKEMNCWRAKMTDGRSEIMMAVKSGQGDSLFGIKSSSDRKRSDWCCRDRSR
jgi:hypothetical protein